MSNRSYNVTGAPGFASAGASVNIRNEFAAIAAGFAEIEQEIDQKEFAAAAPSEWVNPVRTETYISGTQFKWAGADLSGVMVPHRRVRCTVNDAYVYTEVMSSAYVGGFTVVNLLDSVLTSQLTLVEYATVTPVDQVGSSLSINQFNGIVTGTEYTDLNGSGEKCKLGVVYLGLDDSGNKTFAIVPIPV